MHLGLVHDGSQVSEASSHFCLCWALGVWLSVSVPHARYSDGISLMATEALTEASGPNPLRTALPFSWLSTSKVFFSIGYSFPWPSQQRAVPYETGSRWFWVSFSNSFGQAGADHLILVWVDHRRKRKPISFTPGPGLLGRVPRIYWHSNLVGRINTFHTVYF